MDPSETFQKHHRDSTPSSRLTFRDWSHLLLHQTVVVSKQRSIICPAQLTCHLSSRIRVWYPNANYHQALAKYPLWKVWFCQQAGSRFTNRPSHPCNENKHSLKVWALWLDLQSKARLQSWKQWWEDAVSVFTFLRLTLETHSLNTESVLGLNITV